MRATGAAAVLGFVFSASIASRALKDACPNTRQGKQAEQRFKHQAKHDAHPLFSGHHIQYPCPAGRSGCANPVPYYWEAFCSFKTGWEKMWTDYMICPPEKQSAVIDYYTSRRHVAGVADLLDFTPCDLWPLIRDWALWSVRDSYGVAFQGARPMNREEAAFEPLSEHVVHWATNWGFYKTKPARYSRRGRTLWIVGDSHTYDLYHAVACLMLDFWDYSFLGARPIDGEEAAFEALSEHVMHSKPPECLPLAEGTMICHFRVNHGQILMGHGLPLLERMGKPTDIAVLNFGAWHGSGDGPEFRKLIEDFRDAVADRAGKLPRVVWKEMVPTHYDQQHGLYPGGEPPYECKPLHVALQDDGTIAPTDNWSQIIIEQGQQNKVAREVFAGTDIIMTSFWNATVEMSDFHRDISDSRGHECSHYCFGGVPQVWVYHAYKAISEAHWSPLRTQSSKAGLQE